MRKLIQIQLTTAVQFQAPLGVQKIVNVRTGPRHNAELRELPNGDVEVHVIGNRYSTFHLVHRESIVQKLYEQEKLAEVIDLTQSEPPPAKPEHWKTRQKREKAEAAKKAAEGA